MFYKFYNRLKNCNIPNNFNPLNFTFFHKLHSFHNNQSYIINNINYFFNISYTLQLEIFFYNYDYYIKNIHLHILCKNNLNLYLKCVIYNFLIFKM